MCGINGILSKTPSIQGQDIKHVCETMRDLLAHRGPDNAGLWASSNNQVCLGHRRLSIIDLQSHSNQPFKSNNSRYILTFNGEIYNYKILKTELEKQGVKFTTDSDTEVLLNAFILWGKQCVNKLHGMFAFAIWDQKENKLFCARDRAGEKPFYYALINDNFIFASELKSLLSWPEVKKELNQQSILDFLSFGFIPEPRTIWSDCFKLSPGHYLEVTVDNEGRSHLKEETQYWDFEFTPDYSKQDWTDEILSTLSECSSEMTCSDVPLGSFLSGGVDSSAVTAALSHSGHNVKTYTIGFDEENYDERPWAKMVSEQYHTQHNERVVKPHDINSVFDKMLWHYDEPFSDYSYLPTYYVCRDAKKDITVALSGDGADEAFAGYLKYQRLGSIEHYKKFLPRQAFGLMSAAATPMLGQTNRLARMLKQYGESNEKLLADMLFIGAPLASVKSVTHGSTQKELNHYTPYDTVARHLQSAKPDEVGLINSMRYLDMKLTLASDILVKVDRASMAVSLEVRPVFLHPKMLSLAQRIPSNLLADKDHTKQALKLAMKKWLPESLLFRKKMGFAMPLKSWLNTDKQSPLSMPVIHEQLNDTINLKTFNKFKLAHQSGRADYTALLHSIYFLNSWLLKWQH